MSTTTSTTMASIPPPKGTRVDVDRDVAGCLVSSLYSSFGKGNVPGIMKHFQSECSKPEVLVLLEAMGMESPTFHPNPHLQKGAENPVFDKFQKAISTLDQNCNCSLGVVFHGTPQKNIQSILQSGLDRAKRTGQAYGPGEYFSKDSALSVSYCRGGLEMLVFIAVLPSTLSHDDAESKKDDKNDANRYHYRSVPADMVVVENNAHQLPLGTIKFKSVSTDVLAYSAARQLKLRQLTLEVFSKSQDHRETLRKEQVMRSLIFGQTDVAAEQWERFRKHLKPSSMREVAWYVHKNVDEQVVPVLFPDLPEPMNPEEIQKAKVQSVEDAAKQVDDAKKQLEVERKSVVLKNAKNRNAGSGPGATSWSSASNIGNMGTGFTFGAAALGAAALGVAAYSSHTARNGPLSGASAAPPAAGTVFGASTASNPQARGTRSLFGASPSATNANAAAPPSAKAKEADPAPNSASSTIILQHLIGRKIDAASELYQKLQKSFSREEQQDFYFYAKRQVDPDLMDYLFPGLKEAAQTTESSPTTTFQIL